MNLRYLIGMLLLAVSLKAMEVETPPTSSSAKLKELVKMHTLSENDGSAVKEWLAGHESLVRCMVNTERYGYDKTFKPFNPEALLSLPWGEAKLRLRMLGIISAISSNYIFNCPAAENYKVKVPSQTNRALNVVEWYSLNVLKKPRREMTEQDGDAVVAYFKKNPEALGTYQGISRVFCTDRLKKLFATNVLDNSLIDTSDAYLQPYPWTQENDPVNDKYYLPLEVVVKGEVLTEETWKLLSPKSVVELLKAAQHGYLWSMKPDNFMKTSDGKIYPIDLEQPNRWFYGDDLENNKKACQLYAVNGMTEVMRMAKGNKDQHDAVKAYVKDLNMDFFCEEAQSHLKAKPEFKEILGIS